MQNTSSPYWVLVADSGCARIFAARREPPEFSEVHELVSATRHQRTREMMSDSIGRTVDEEGGRASHTMKPRSDPHDQAESAFSTSVLNKLEQAAERNEFQHLAVIADPKTLGRLRQHMSKALSARVTNELNRDLVALPLDALKERVWSELGWSD